MIGSWIDRAIGVVAPQWAMRRMSARATMEQISSVAGGGSGYDAGKLNRLTRSWPTGRVTENSIPTSQVERLRAAAWDLYRNNHNARKVCRNLLAKVVGRGLTVKPQAKREDGTPHDEFRAMAKQLWRDIGRAIDYRGRPGRGGTDLVGMQKLALRSAILSGEVLCRTRLLTKRQQERLRLPVPVQLQLIHGERLDSSATVPKKGSHTIYRGIELDSRDQRAGYHILKAAAGEVQTAASYVPAGDIVHLYADEDVDQLRGVTWFAPVLMRARDTGDYEYNELKASALAACVAMSVKPPTGATGWGGVQTPSNWEPTDGDGNPVSYMQPGMIFKNAEISGFNPNRPNANASDWIQHLVRTTAAGIPGVKASTLTGNYRGSSFSSERSADNDVWPELYDVQDWFAINFMQPIYEFVISTAFNVGYFDSIATEVPRDGLVANWQGPVALSINPKDDAIAAGLRIATGQSSPQIEAGVVGKDFFEMLDDLQEAYKACISHGLPENLALQLIGLNENVLSALAASEGDDDESKSSSAKAAA